MSLEDGVRGDGAERAFWKIPELVEKLLDLLDLDSIKHLAENHELTCHILGKPFVWKKLIKRPFPEDVEIRLDLKESLMPLEDDAHLANDRPKARLLAEILGLIKGSPPGSQPEMDLLHAVCDRYPARDASYRQSAGWWFHFVDVSCACMKTHEVSPWGFVLLEEVQASLPGEQSVLEVDYVHASLCGPFLMALSSMVTRQQGMKMEILPNRMTCNSREGAEAIANVANGIQANRSHSPFIDIDGEIEAEGWAAIRRVVEHLADRIAAEDIWMDIDRKAMAAGAEEDLRAIWARVSYWNVVSVGWELFFSKEDDGERAGWEGVEGELKGIRDVISMTEEEWLVEAEKNGTQDSEDEESQSEESEAEEEGEYVGPE